MRRKNKDTSPSKPTRNYVYKVKALVGDEMLRAIGDQMHLAHEYKNNLIRIDRTRREESHAAICEFDPAIPRIEAEIEAADDAIEALQAAIRKRGQDARKRSLATVEERDRSAELKEERAGCRADLKARKAVAYADPEIHARLDVIKAAAGQARKDAYNASPAFWPTKLAAEESLRDMGKGAPPRFRRWSQHGTIAVQVQKGMEWAEALLCRDPRVRVQVPAPPELRPVHGKNGAFLPVADPESVRSREHKLALVWLRIGTADDGRSPVWAKLLVHVHRQPPPDARIKWTYLHRYLVGRQIRWKLRFALTRDEWESEHGEAGVAYVNIGWKMTPEGMATPGFAATDMPWRPITEASEAIFVRGDKSRPQPEDPDPTIYPPEGMRIAYAVGSDGVEYVLVLPHDQVDRWHHCERLRAIRDRSFNAIRDGLLAWFHKNPRARDVLVAALRDSEPPKTKLADSLSRLHQWESPDRLQELAWWWKDHRFPADRMVVPAMMDWRRDHARLAGELGSRPLRVFEELEAWRRQDRHLHDREDHQRSKAIRWRDEQYRRFAAIVCRTYRDVRIKDVDWAKVKEKAEDGREDDPVMRLTRLNFQIAAPGTLQRFLVEAASKDHVEKLTAKDLADLMGGFAKSGDDERLAVGAMSCER